MQAKTRTKNSKACETRQMGGGGAGASVGCGPESQGPGAQQRRRSSWGEEKSQEGAKATLLLRARGVKVTDSGDGNVNK